MSAELQFSFHINEKEETSFLIKVSMKNTPQTVKAFFLEQH